MTQEEYDDVRQLWALTHACFEFEQVEIACDDLLTVHTDREQPIYRALLTAIYVTYGRPFKGSNSKLKISENLVPPEFLKVHFGGSLVNAHSIKIDNAKNY